MTPTRSAERPNHSMNVPGATTSMASRMPPAMNQFHSPRERTVDTMARAASAGLPAAHHRTSRSGWTARRRHRGRLAVAAERLARDLADAGKRAEHVDRLDREHQYLLVGRLRELGKRAQVFLRDEVVERGDVAAGHGGAHHLGRLRLRLRGAL